MDNDKYDESLLKMFETENKSVNKFFDNIFNFFYRNFPDVVFDNLNNYGKQKMVSSYDKWEKLYLQRKKNSVEKIIIDSPVEEENGEKSSCWREAPNPGGPTYTTNTHSISKTPSNKMNSTSVTKSKKEKLTDDAKTNFFDTTNGAKFEYYSWTQSMNDLDVRVPVESFIKKGAQVEVNIDKNHLKVKLTSGEADSKFVTVINGHLPHHVRVDDCVWLLSPGQHISILLEKLDCAFWDRLLSSDPPIDMKKIRPERDYEDLPEEDKRNIAKVMSDRHKQERGEPTSDQEKMASMLQKAWNAEGSPFKGQPFDPSMVNIVAKTL